MQADIATQVREFIADNFLFREERSDISDTESLLDAGLIDSTGILELVAYLEQAFAIQMADAEIVPENLDSVQAITAYVMRKKRETAAAA